MTALDEVLQLKPKENSFFKMSRNVTKLDVIFICEGKRDSEVLKGVIYKCFEGAGRGLAVTDCEGRDAVTEVARYIVALSSVSRTLRAVAIVIDADEYSPVKRVRTIVDSLRSFGIEVGVTEAGEGAFRFQSENIRVEVFVKVVSDPDLPHSDSINITVKALVAA
nr:hypothetical protein [Candidatus Freyrarchaeum guaymaensis]